MTVNFSHNLIASISFFNISKISENESSIESGLMAEVMWVNIFLFEFEFFEWNAFIKYLIPSA